MANYYKFDEESSNGFLNKYRDYIYEYTLKINELITIQEEIYNSSEWQDTELKTSFNNSYQAYIDTYLKIVTSMVKNIDFMQKKVQAADELNRSYNRSA